MKTFLLTALATAFANTVSFLIYQGFVKSYWGRQTREEITRFLDRFKKYYKK